MASHWHPPHSPGSSRGRLRGPSLPAQNDHEPSHDAQRPGSRVLPTPCGVRSTGVRGHILEPRRQHGDSVGIVSPTPPPSSPPRSYRASSRSRSRRRRRITPCAGHRRRASGRGPFLRIRHGVRRPVDARGRRYQHPRRRRDPQGRARHEPRSPAPLRKGLPGDVQDDAADIPEAQVASDPRKGRLRLLTSGKSSPPRLCQRA
ncbi:hypothetical protein C8Q80DRAFT_262836 [Daedaleopsis nitida]|nr:hypothetical protein C8Q80DRAFT_262836 [Daedaleopsis nitida]